ncbi:MmyB family transcriptional regulator [Streptomyces odontomachi]|uniref:MmyB family transcriptional regulator n=1 Tax=Streptomyces odontomachi TaxID=2944940 RepID=UPI002108E3F3|nr:hypothetical protein [Streptomyces sp. ODS25]
MADRAGGRQPGSGLAPGDPEVHAYLVDYAALLYSQSYPSVVFDHRWDVILANPAFDALFEGISPHPTAMPGDNLLRFVLFHPDAGTVLEEHESSWCLPMLAHLAQALTEHGQDAELMAIRRDIAQDPIMEAAFRQGLPHWLRAVGPAAVAYDGPVRPLWHPNPRWGRTHCRLVCNTPRTLDLLGYRHLTFVLREPLGAARTGRTTPGARRPLQHLRSVPAVDA